MSDCNHRQRLNAYLDGELAPAETAELESHLRQCGICTAEMEAMRRLSRLLQGAQLPRLSDARVDAMVRRIQAERSKTRRLVQAITAIAASIAIAGIGLLLGSRGSAPDAELPDPGMMQLAAASAPAAVYPEGEQVYLVRWILSDLSEQVAE